MHQMRAAALTGYLEVARSVGLDGERVLREAGLPLRALADPENRLPAIRVLRVIDRSAELSHCEHFGLLMAEARSFASLGPVSLLLERLPNVRAMVLASIELEAHLNDVVTITLDEHGDTALIRFGLLPGFRSVTLFDYLVALGARTLSGGSGGQWQPECFHFTRRVPADPAPWRRVLGPSIEFDAAFDGLSSPLADMMAPNPRADETMAQHARRLLNLVKTVSGEDTPSDRVRREIGIMLPTRRVTFDQVAARLGYSARSLQRQLESEGHQFGDLLNEVRRELALGYLADTDRPVTAVAGLLGYAAPSSFTRWFTQTFGMSPQAWRAERRAMEKTGPTPVWRREDG